MVQVGDELDVKLIGGTTLIVNCAVLLGFIPLQPLALLQIGRPAFPGVAP